MSFSEESSNSSRPKHNQQRRMSGVQDQVTHAVETAKEAVGKMGEQVSDFFQGNPFATPVGKKIEIATDANLLATENWGLNMEICDFINNTEEGGKDAVRAIRKRLHNQMSKNNAIVMYTLTVLETCVKNCDHRFHALVCQKDFILDLVKLIGPKFDAPQIVQERVLSLIQAWADAFRGQPDLQGVGQVYEDLRAKGVEFPPTDLDTLAPIITPKRTVFPDPSLHAESQQQPAANPGTYEVAPMPPVGTPVVASSDQLVKLRKDMDVVNSNIKVFREMLTEIVPNKATVDELQLLSELNATCRQMQNRLLELIRHVSNEEVSYELLVANDELNSVFEKFERFMVNKESDETQESSVQLIDINDTTPLADQLNNLSMSTATAGVKPADSYAANREAQAEVGLRTAAFDKTVPVSDREAAEMEGWLAQQEKPAETKKSDAENDKL